MVASRLTLTNRPENLRLLLDFIQKWALDRGLPPGRLNSLELATTEIFRHLVDHAYGPDEPGSIAVELEEKGPRLRLLFEDDANPQPSKGSNPGNPAAVVPPLDAPHLNGLQRLAESLIYYRTADRKNRLVVFLN
jgi:anti-sigma regulatory factor (Ser/Thr protein kinase)